MVMPWADSMKGALTCEEGLRRLLDASTCTSSWRPLSFWTFWTQHLDVFLGGEC
jgi:hypothetical protein